MTSLRVATVFACSFLASATVGEATTSEGSAKRPNIVLIMADDMGFSDVGCYGGEIETPTLDTLAAGGVRFTQFYNTARCCPTRAALLTGLYPHQAGVGHMTEDKGPQFPGYRGELNAQCVTIAEVLKQAGYGTYAVGKWHVVANRNIKQEGSRDNWPRQRGFDRFYGMISGGGSFYDPWTLARDNQLISPYADAEYQPARYYFTDAISDHAVRFAHDHGRDRPGQPFFMYVAYTAAHWPMHALEEDIAKYRGKYDAGYDAIRTARFEKAARLGLIDPQQGISNPGAEWGQVNNRAREIACMEVYAAMVDRMDQGIGRLVAELKRSGQYDNTLIFYLQDNGGCAEEIGRGVTKDRVDGPRAERPSLEPIAADRLPAALVPPQTRDGYPVRQGPNVLPGPYDSYVAYGRGWANVSNTPFREYKHWVHEGGISTPLIAHWPAGISSRNELRAQPGHLIDIMATCVDVAGANYPDQFDQRSITPLEGKSLVPAFDNKPIERDAIYWEHEGNRAIRQGDWKLVANGPAGPWALYDLKSDRIESHDLAEAEPARVTAMATLWTGWAKRTNVIPWIWQPQYEAQSDEKVFEGDWELVTGDAGWRPRDSSGELVYRDRLWLFGGWFDSFQAPPRDAWSSLDGKKWERVTDEAPWRHSDLPMTVAFQDRMWFMGGWYNGRLPGHEATNDVWSSSDGVEWSRAAAAGWSPRIAAATAVFQGKMWVLGGTENYYFGDASSLKNDVWSSDDGVTWKCATEHAGWSPRAYHQAVVLGDRLFIMGGGNYVPEYQAFNDVWSTKDGVNWEQVTASAPWHPRIWFSSVVYRDHMWVLGGWSNNPSRNWGDVWYSADGEHWRELKSRVVWKARHEHSAYVHRDRIWVAGGHAQPLSNEVWSLHLPK